MRATYTSALSVRKVLRRRSPSRAAEHGNKSTLAVVAQTQRNIDHGSIFRQHHQGGKQPRLLTPLAEALGNRLAKHIYHQLNY